MKKAVGIVLLVALGGAAAFAFTRWPMINDVETGKTPEYPDLQPRAYGPGEEAVVRAARAALEGLPRFTFVAAGSGPGGSEIQAVATTRFLRFKDDVTIRIRRQGGTTRVSVRSRSRVGEGDFGQNARNIRELLDALDRQLGVAGGRGQGR